MSRHSSIAVLPFCHTQAEFYNCHYTHAQISDSSFHTAGTDAIPASFRLHDSFTTHLELITCWLLHPDEPVEPSEILFERQGFEEKLFFKKMTHAHLDNRIGELYLLAKDVLV